MRKRFALLFDEFKRSVGGTVIMIIMLTAILIFGNMMSIALIGYISYTIYLSGSCFDNVVEVTSYADDPFSELELISAFDEVEVSFTHISYSGECNAHVLSPDFLKKEYGFLSKENIDAINNYDGDAIPVIAIYGSNYGIGYRDKLTIDDEMNIGVVYDISDFEVVGITENDALFWIFGGGFRNSVLVIDEGQFENIKSPRSAVLFAKLTYNADPKTFANQCHDAFTDAEILDTISLIDDELNRAMPDLIIGGITSVAAFVSTLINSYLIFCKNRKYYNTLMIVGAKPKIFLFNNTLLKLLWAIISIVFSFVALCLLSQTMRKVFITFTSMSILILVVVIILIVTELLLAKWIKHEEKRV